LENFLGIGAVGQQRGHVRVNPPLGANEKLHELVVLLVHGPSGADSPGTLGFSSRIYPLLYRRLAWQLVGTYREISRNLVDTACHSLLIAVTACEE
jgi:hypothetical protein